MTVNFKVANPAPLPDYDPKAAKPAKKATSPNAESIQQQVVDMLRGSGAGGDVTNAVAAYIGGLTSQISHLQTMMDGASIAAECNEDQTITVTLTWGS